MKITQNNNKTDPYSSPLHARWIAGSLGQKVSDFLFKSNQPNFKTQQRLANWHKVTSHTVVDPNQFTDPNMRWAALAARADRIMSDRRFQQLHTDQQQQILGAYYDKYVKPGYESLGFSAPDRDLWLRQIPNEQGKINSKAFFPGINSRQQQLMAAGMGDSLGDMSHFMTHGGVWLSKMASYSLLGIGKLLHITNIPDYTNLKAAVSEKADEHNKQLDAITDSAFDQDRLWLQVHKSHSYMDKLDSGAGELFAQLPLWESLGSMRLGIAAKTDMLLPEGAKISNLTAKLMATKKGAFVAHRLANLADGYVGSIVTGSDQKSAIMGALGYMGLAGILGDIEHEVKIPTDLKIKELTAGNIAMGGTILQHAVTDQADTELANGILGHDSQGRPISIVPKTDTTGHIKVGENLYKYDNKDMQQHMITTILQDSENADPVHTSIMKAEKLTLSALAKKFYPEKQYWRDLSQAQRKTIRLYRESLTKEALVEVPLHNPDIAKANLKSENEADIKSNPDHAQVDAMLKQKWGMDVSDIMYANEADAIEKKTGIKSPTATIRNVVKVSKKFADAKIRKNEISQETIKKFNELNNKAQERASKDTLVAKGIAEEEPRKFAQMKLNTISYFRNDFAKDVNSKYETPKETKEAIKEMDPEEYSRELLEHMGNTFSFEGNVKHRLLWANVFRKELPKFYQNKLIKSLHELNPKETIKVWDEQSKNLAMHMQELAYVGRLFSEGNIFRSTRVNNWLDRTIYQDQLDEEVENKELAALKMVLGRYPKAYKEALEFTKFLQAERRAKATAQEYGDITDVIREHKLSALKKRVGVK